MAPGPYFQPFRAGSIDISQTPSVAAPCDAAFQATPVVRERCR
jgi:hypothetical protein